MSDDLSYINNQGNIMFLLHGLLTTFFSGFHPGSLDIELN